ncbi:tRNA (adenosine(37)-N6)-dimethylallyltransferase MiaA [Candidatus Kaiserbacteria bacterium]|nr:tRNA (adenosine(37)-N6)-dimethylallyltransferase MiaA [Candidatus Kaiserbacteria bacterium]
MQKPKVIAIVGPTASGKSSLGVWLAKRIQGGSCGAEIISADSRQVYKGLDIGTGKVTKKEMAGIPHHLLSVASPKKQFTVDDFVKGAEHAYASVLQNTAIAIVVGGTGLYVDMFLGRMAYPNVPPNPTLRTRLEQRSVKQLFAQLKKLDPRRAATIEPDHKRRLIRAIEIAKAIGQSPLPQPETKYEVLWLGLDPKNLQNNIRIRLGQRIQAGMIAEAKRLHKAGLSYKRMEELGLEYRHLSALLQKKITQKEFETQLERAIWQYAKRQRRWFKRNKDIVWVSGKAEALRLAKNFLSGR